MRSLAPLLTILAGGLATIAASEDLPGSAPLCDEVDLARDCDLIPYFNVLFFDYETEGEVTTLTLVQTAPEGGSRLVSDPIAIEGPVGPPFLLDVNSDLTEELLIPVAAGDLVQVLAVWQEMEDGFFAPAGSFTAPVSGEIAVDGPVIVTRYRQDWSGEDGQDGTGEDDEAAVEIEAAAMLGPEGMIPVYRIEIAEGVCTLVEDAGLAAAALDAEEVLAACMAAMGPDEGQDPEDAGSGTDGTEDDGTGD